MKAGYGIRMMLMASLVFAGVNLCVKLVPRIPVFEIVFFRAMISFLLSFLILKRKKLPVFGNNKKVLLLRGIFGTFALIFYFYTLHAMPLASAMVIHYLSPVFTATIAHFILKEKLQLRHVFFFLISFAGVFMMKGFDARLSWSDVTIGVLSALASGAAYNCIRWLKFTEDSNVIILYFPMVAFPITFILMMASTGFIIPEWNELGLLLLIGVLTQIAQYFLTRAYQSESANKVAAVTNVGVVYALLIGYFVFAETFTINSLAGMALVMIGVLLNIFWKPKRNLEKSSA
ncbi:MAG: EamA family transporter [Bacteroidetes bacterium]|nr:EamA family transporter [Bacteroidota bacterium]